MVKNKKLTILIVQISLLGIFVSGIYHFTQKELKPVEVYVFASKMPKNTEIELSDLKKKEIPSKAVTSDFLTEKEIEKIKEGNMVLSTDVLNNQYAYKGHITESEKVDPFETIDLSRYRKISLSVSYSDTMAGEIRKGDKVDLAFISNVEGVDGEATYAKVFMQDVLVYNVTTGEGFQYVSHSQIKKSELANEENTDIANEDFSPISLVTFAVPIDDAEELLARINSGTVQIVGRFEESVDTDS
ncbi:MAG: hypothetical protein IJH34_07380, partial [Romboutsia sp.]|nr:hypothetical protein [Romboutsia sp.]